MVRINLVPPRKLTDQHLIAEYNEILMLIGHIKKFPTIRNQPEDYTLGTGHINFFKDKIKYLHGRHSLIKKEMTERGFIPKKSFRLSEFKPSQKKDFRPTPKDIQIIKKRIKEKILQKPTFYRYYREHKSPEFLINLLR